MKRKANQMRKMRKTLKNKPSHLDKPNLQMLHQHPCAIFFNLLLVSNLSILFTQDAKKTNFQVCLRASCNNYDSLAQKASSLLPYPPSPPHPPIRQEEVCCREPLSWPTAGCIKTLLCDLYGSHRSYREIFFLWVESVGFHEQ